MVSRLFAIPTPPLLPLSPLSSPLPHILSPPLPIPSPPLLASPTYPLGYRAVMIKLRAESPSTSHPPPLIVLPHSRASIAILRADAPSTYILAPRLKTSQLGTPPLLSIPLHASSPPLLLPSTNYRVDVHEVPLPPRKRIAGSRPHKTDTASRGTDYAKDTVDTDGSIVETTRTC
nr:hypothetical protein [Tanacetum cinerariifolium]